MTMNRQQSRRIHLIIITQGGITCGAIDEPRKSSKVIDERVIMNAVNAHFRDKNGVCDFDYPQNCPP